MNERRHSRRRSLPFVRSAVLEVGDSSYIVILTDLSTEGAFVTTRLPFVVPDPPPPMRLRLVIPRDSRDATLPCELVWRNERFDAATGRPTGLALRFLEVDAETFRRVENFAREGFRPSAAPRPAEHYEHRILDRPVVDVQDLNRFGKDGWQLVTIMPAEHGFKLVLVRRI